MVDWKLLPTATSLKIRPEELLRFFDEKPESSIGHATSIVSIVGEDLNAACFQHYLQSQGAESSILDDPVTTGRRKGPRLDRWIDVVWADKSRTVFQTEIKNSSAHAIGGAVLNVSATPEEVAEYRQARWDHHWNIQCQTFNSHITAKVLARMRPPGGVDEDSVRPLLIFWEAIGPQDKTEDHLFRVEATCDFAFSLPNTWPTPSEYPDAWGFQELWVFSVSSYLRSIQDASIELNMPNAAHRLRVLGRLFPTAHSNL